jgi:enolase
VATSITKSIDVKGAITKVLDSKGKPLSGIKVAISKSGKVIATFPKGTKTGTYTVRVITKSKKVINLSVKVVKK